jgi:polyvinyl alcohol dehydrogenase (cytochrome)
VKAHGGSIDVAGVQAVGRMIYVQSGYMQFGQIPGNVLLAFELVE